MQKLVLAWCLSAILFGAPIVSFADANNGELLGFKIGEKCPDIIAGITVTEEVDVLTFALQPSYAGANVPDDFKVVNLECSKESFTIGAIKAFTRMRSAKAEGEIASAVIDAGEIAEKYKAMLEAEYPDWEGLPDGSRSNKLEIANGKYVLYVRFYTQEAEPSFLEMLVGDEAREATVLIGLRYLGGSKAHQNWSDVIEREAQEVALKK